MSRIVGLDLGSTSVKVVQLSPKGRGAFDVVGYGQAAVPPADDGQDEKGSRAERLGTALEELKARGLLDGDVFVTGLSGGAAALRTLALPFSDPKKIAEALPFALESEISLDLEDIVLSWLPLGPAAAKEAAGQTEVLVGYARQEAVQGLLDLLAVHGIDPRHVELPALALDDLYDGVLAGDDDAGAAREGPTELRTPGGTVIEVGDGAPEPAVAVVDIGHGSTDVCVLAGDRVVSAATLLHGGADATRALAKAIGLPRAEAERGKRKEAFIEVTGARAQFPEQEQISEVLKGAYAPVVRRLRQIFQAAISQARVRVVKVYLVGGGSRALNLDRHLAEELNVKVLRPRALSAALKGHLPLDAVDDGAPEAALAFGYALSAVPGRRTRGRVDFRTGPFAWKGDFDFVRERAPVLGAWAAVLLVLLAASGIARAFVLGSTEQELAAQELALCRQIVGDATLDSYARCSALIQERIAGTASFSVPERSAVDTYFEVAHRLPPTAEVRRKITELDITSERVKLRGLTSSFEAVDKIVESLQGGKCFSVVEKGKAQQKGADVDFSASIVLDCAAAPGDGRAPAKAPAPPSGTFARPSVVPSPTTPIPTTPAAMERRPDELDPQRFPTADDLAAERAARRGVDDDGDDDAERRRPSRLTPEEIEQRREKLRKLREERELRRTNRLGVPGIGPQGGPRGQVLRDRFKRMNAGADDAIDEEE